MSWQVYHAWPGAFYCLADSLTHLLTDSLTYSLTTYYVLAYLAHDAVERAEHARVLRPLGRLAARGGVLGPAHAAEEGVGRDARGTDQPREWLGLGLGLGLGFARRRPF